jgi:hypothetical protein
MNSTAEFALPRGPLYVYRSSCVAMLRRYFQMSVELGRLPALLGREFFRSRSDTIRESWFEDAVIYVHDIESCLESLHHFDQQVIARVVLQEYAQEDAARLLGCTDRHLRNRLAVGLDVLAQLFLERKLMVVAKPGRRERAVEHLPMPKETADDPSVAEQLSDDLQASAEENAGDFISMRDVAEDESWRDLPVEISCQAPQMSQIRASC